ncbi:LOW QUALITY PROTEIN: uncharacterized protein ACOB6Z_010531 [Ctenodactylus gundi]
MSPGNMTLVTEFILMGVSGRPELQVPLFLVFLVIYVLTAAGNLGIIALTTVDPRLQTPMYFFLRHLAVINLGDSTVIAPKMLSNFLAKKKTISYYGCATQLGGFLVFIVAEIFMLAVMAYDRYVAICNPLLYPLLYGILVPRRLCIQMVASTYTYGFTVGLVQTVATFHLSFCGSRVVNHFYCDDVPLMALACSDTHVKELMLLITEGVNALFSLVIVVILYIFILSAVLRMHSAKGRRKAFSTCASHLASITIFYGTIVFMYLQPKSSHSLNTDKLASVFYVVMIPMLNPLISLRNQEVKSGLRKIIEKLCLTFNVLPSSADSYSSFKKQLPACYWKLKTDHGSQFTCVLDSFPAALFRRVTQQEWVQGENQDNCSCDKGFGGAQYNILPIATTTIVPWECFPDAATVMEKVLSNDSAAAGFILLGFTESPGLQVTLFGAFLVVYLVSVLSNLGLIVLIHLSPHLHIPMYFFLSHLAFVDFSYTSTVTPNALVHFLCEVKSIAFHACAAQVCCFIMLSVCEMYLLAIMAYDRYVAICHPLLYVILMPRRLCIQMVTSTYVYGFSVGLVQTVATFRLSFCGSNVINHFYCDDVPLIALACSDTHVKELMLFIVAGFNFLFSLVIVVISYIFILSTILRMHSAEGRRKAFSTCASHLASITIFYGTLIFMYLQPKSSHSLNTDKIASVFYVMVIPMLNPLIYSLRNKEVKNAVKLAVVCSRAMAQGNYSVESGFILVGLTDHPEVQAVLLGAFLVITRALKGFALENCSSAMAPGNHSAVSGFILLGLTDSPELQVILFGVFSVVYSVSVMGNLGLIALILVSPHLHTPMYFFLSHLAFIDFCFSSSVSPNMLVHFWFEVKNITFYACAIQLCCFVTFVVSELYVLSIMAYDRYVAICHPLLYIILMPRRLCIQMVTSTYVYGFTVGLVQAVSSFRLSFCGSNVINHFYCDDVPLVALACSDTHVKELLLLIFAGFNTLCSLVIVVISYIFILSAILRMDSAEGRQKAFSTCASHLTSITIFYGTLIFMYLQPKSSHSLHTDKFASVFYVVVIPMLNPLIYSLRNQEVKRALRKITEKLCLAIK